MVIKNEILINQETEFITLCRKHKVKYLYAFGSSTTDKFDFNKSDIDLVVEIDAIANYTFESKTGLDNLNSFFYINAPALLFPYLVSARKLLIIFPSIYYADNCA